MMQGFNRPFGALSGATRRQSLARRMLFFIAACFLAIVPMSGAPRPVQAGLGAWTQTTGPFGGDITAVVVDPQAPSTLYATDFNVGVFKSTNGGTSWTAINAGLPTDFGFSALAIDPKTPSTLYLGHQFRGVFESSTGGASWHPIDNGLTDQNVYSLAIDPKTPATLYAGTNDGAFKSVDDGLSWQPFSNGPPPPFDPTGLHNHTVHALAIDPLTPSIRYAAEREGIFKIDGNVSWQAVSASVGSPSADALAIDPTNTSRVYAGSISDGVLRSTDGGASWSQASDGLVTFGANTVAVDPTAPATLYTTTGGFGVFKSTNGGATWRLINNGLTSLFVSGMAIDPKTPTTLFVATSGGVFRSLDGGASWSAFSDGLPADTVDVVVDPSAPGIRYAGTALHGVYRQAGDAAWQSVSVGLPANPSISALAIDPQVTTTLYAGVSSAGVFKSTNSGATWSLSNAGMGAATVRSLAVDPLTPATLYAASPLSGAFKSTNGAASWAPIDDGLPSFNTPTIAIDPRSPATLYAGSGTKGAYKSTDGGVSWSPFNSGPPIFSGLAVQQLAVSPGLSSTIFAATNVGLFTIEQPIDLTLAVSGPTGPLAVGSTLPFSYTVTNTADIVGQNLTLSVPIPPGTVFQSIGAGTWTCSAPGVGATGTVSCTRSTLLGGAREGITVSLQATAAGTFSATGSVSSANTDPSTDNNTASTSFTIAAPPPPPTAVPAVCNPRPNVAVTAAPVGPGQLQATISAQMLPATPSNGLQRIAIARIDNAAVLMNGSPVGAGANVALPAGTSQVTLVIRRQTTEAASMVSFVVTDACGDWPSFVGGGPGAF